MRTSAGKTFSTARATAGSESGEDVKPSEPIDPIEIYELKVADATKVAAALKSMVPQQAAATSSRYSRYSRYGSTAASQPVMVYADTITNSVFVRAPESQRKTISDLIAKLDRADQAATRVLRIVPLKNVPASQIVQVVNQFHGATASPFSSPAITLLASFRFARSEHRRRQTVRRARSQHPSGPTAKITGLHPADS